MDKKSTNDLMQMLHMNETMEQLMVSVGMDMNSERKRTSFREGH